MKKELTKTIILASASQRRTKILKSIGLKHKICVANACEVSIPEKGPEYNVKKNAEIKATAIIKKHPNSLIIGADTIVFNNTIIGKPKNLTEAKNTLKNFSERELLVFSGVCVLDAKTQKKATTSAITKVRVKKLTKKIIDEICAKLTPLDRAGSFSIEGIGAFIFDNIDGSFYNVLGLPLCALHEAFDKLKIDIIDLCTPSGE